MSDIIGMMGLITGGTEDAISQIDIPQDGFIIGIDWDANATLNATENIAIELSFIATNQLLTNDTRGRISAVSGQANQVSAVGVPVVIMQKWLGSFDVSVSGGERLYLHAISTAGVTGVVRCGLYVELGTVTRRAARRR